MEQSYIRDIVSIEEGTTDNFGINNNKKVTLSCGHVIFSTAIGNMWTCAFCIDCKNGK